MNRRKEARYHMVEETFLITVAKDEMLDDAEILVTDSKWVARNPSIKSLAMGVQEVLDTLDENVFGALFDDLYDNYAQ